MIGRKGGSFEPLFIHRLRAAGMHKRRVKAAELASGIGAIVLGAGLALVLPEWLRRYGVVLLIGGGVVHAVGMTLKYRLEQRDGPALWWERSLFWLCWLCLAALGVWIAAGLLAPNAGSPR